MPRPERPTYTYYIGLSGLGNVVSPLPRVGTLGYKYDDPSGLKRVITSIISGLERGIT